MSVDLKILSLLLSYPSEELQKTGPLLHAMLDEMTELQNPTHQKLNQLIDYIAKNDLYAVQEDYVTLFDRTRSLSLHLFEHVHGESRDRGQAMVDLKNMYEDAGFEINASELPDYLPMFLEYLSTRAADEARQSLGDVAHIVGAIEARLEKRNSPYQAAFTALLELGASPDASLLDELLSQPEDDPNDLAALDEIWEEEVIRFSGNQGENNCGPDRLRTRIRASNRDRQSPHA